MAVSEHELATPNERFDRLYRRYFRDLVKYCNASLWDRAASEDVAQEAFLRAYRYQASLDPTRPPWPWLKTIARSVISDRGARASREVPGDVPDVAVTPIDGAELTLAFTGAIDSLPSRQRMALHLRYVLGFEPERAASVLHVSVPAFNQLVFRSRERLRAELRSLGHAVPAFVLLPFQRLRDMLYRRRSPRPSTSVLLRVPAELLVQVGTGLIAILIVAGGGNGHADAGEGTTRTGGTSLVVSETKGGADAASVRHAASLRASAQAAMRAVEGAREGRGAGASVEESEPASMPPASGDEGGAADATVSSTADGEGDASPADDVMTVVTAVAEDPDTDKTQPVVSLNPPADAPDVPEEVEEVTSELPPVPSVDPPPLPVEPPPKIKI